MYSLNEEEEKEEEEEEEEEENEILDIHIYFKLYRTRYTTCI